MLRLSPAKLRINYESVTLKGYYFYKYTIGPDFVIGGGWEIYHFGGQKMALIFLLGSRKSWRF